MFNPFFRTVGLRFGSYCNSFREVGRNTVFHALYPLTLGSDGFELLEYEFQYY